MNEDLLLYLDQQYKEDCENKKNILEKLQEIEKNKNKK